MKEKLAGTIAMAKFHEIKALHSFAKKFSDVPISSGLLLTPEEEWSEPIIVREKVKLVLVNGEIYQVKVKGFTLEGTPTAIFVEEIPRFDPENLFGAKVFVFAE